MSRRKVLCPHKVPVLECAEHAPVFESTTGSVAYKYIASITINVKRIDNQMLTDEENAMVQEMHKAAEVAVAKVMADRGGMGNTCRLKKATVVY